MKWLVLAIMLLPATAQAGAKFRPREFVPAEPSASQIAACAPDALRLCADKVPDREAVKYCMLRHKRQLSETCKEAFR